MDKPRKMLGEMLLEKGLISLSQLNHALEVQREEGGILGEILVKLGYITEDAIAQCLSLQLGFPYLPLENYEISKEIVSIIPKKVAEHYCLIALDKLGSTLIVAMADPLNYHAIEDLREITNCDIQVFISTTKDIRKAIQEHY